MADTAPDTDELVFLPLGGCGEIGMNLNAYGYGPKHARRWILADIGVSFGNADTPGIDYEDWLRGEVLRFDSEGVYLGIFLDGMTNPEGTSTWQLNSGRLSFQMVRS